MAKFPGESDPLTCFEDKDTCEISMIGNNSEEYTARDKLISTSCDTDDNSKSPLPLPPIQITSPSSRSSTGGITAHSHSHRTSLPENGNARILPKKKNSERGWIHRYKGGLLALFASFLFPLAGLCVKGLKRMHPFSLSFFRFQGILLPALPMFLYSLMAQDRKEKGDNNGILAPFTQREGRTRTLIFIFLRVFTGTSAVVFQFYSLQYLSLADSSVISFSTPVFVSLAAHVALSESCGVVPLLSGLLALGGVVIISRPPLLTGKEAFDWDTLLGTFLALGCMLCATTTFVVLRALRTVHYSLLNVCLGVGAMVETLALCGAVGRFDVPAGGKEWGLTVALAALSFVTQLAMTLSFKWELAGTVSLIRSCDVIFVFLWEWAVLGVIPDVFSIVGAVVVMTGIVLVGFRKWVGQLPPEDERRIVFRYILI